MDICNLHVPAKVEACRFRNTGDFIDPDITLSYIDEKIQRVLGHFRKDFEGGVTAENLGSKFGGYGSFLPAYKSLPLIQPSTKNQHRDCSTKKLPNNLPLEGSFQNPKDPQPERPVATSCKAVSSHNTSGQIDSRLPSAEVNTIYTPKHGTSSSLGNLKRTGSLKLRIKVGSDSTALKNAAIYNGLGLDDSPILSSENSSDANEGVVPVSQDPMDCSPAMIIQEMTSFPVPGGALLSPLYDSLCFSKKEKSYGEIRSALSLENQEREIPDLVKEKNKGVGQKERQVNSKNKVYDCPTKDNRILNEGKLRKVPCGLKREPVSNSISGEDCLKNSKQKAKDERALRQKAQYSGSCVSEAYKGVRSSSVLEHPSEINNLVPESKKQCQKATLNEEGLSGKTENLGIVGKNKLNGIQKIGDRAAGSFEFEEGPMNGSEALKFRKDDRGIEKLRLGHKIKQRSNNVKVDNDLMTGLKGVQSAPSHVIDNDPAPKAEPAVVIDVEDYWVCCDSCEKWRLLPLGMRPEQLPEKWLCSMLNWLPGMNRCGISEQETTDKLNALNKLPYFESARVSQNRANGLTSGSSNSQFHVISSLKNDHQKSTKSSSLNNLSNPPSSKIVRELHNLAGDETRTKLKEKLVDGGNSMQLKRKSKRPEENDLCFEAVKKSKTMRFVDNHQDSDADLVIEGHSSYSGLSRPVKCNTKDKLQISLKIPVKKVQCASGVISINNQRSYGKSDSCTKKRNGDVMEKTRKTADDMELSMHNEKISSKQALVGKAALKKNVHSQRASMVAEYSSLKVSNSVVKVSPVESVSSSPLRTSSLDKFGEEKNSGGEYKQETLTIDGEPLHVSQKADNFHQISAPKSIDLSESRTVKIMGDTGSKNGMTPDQQGSRDNALNCNTLKEAKDLRDCADHLKSSGFSFESNWAYFQSALKFLDGAFLLETVNNASARHGDMTQTQFYGTAAELSENCAHEYERRKDMAAAALAYKCIEVAYMRAVFSMHSSINGDWRDLHSTLPAVVQGESPSSDVSHVDNMGNQATMDKAASDKGGDSLNAGSQIINSGSGNHVNFAQLFDYTRHTYLAMEALRKAQDAFIMAREAHNTDFVAPIKKVVDFSFQDVAEFTRLVRDAMKAITHSGFGSGRD